MLSKSPIYYTIVSQFFEAILHPVVQPLGKVDPIHFPLAIINHLQDQQHLLERERERNGNSRNLRRVCDISLIP